MRYFRCTALNGRLYLHYVAGAFIYRTAEEVEQDFKPLRDRRIESVNELDETLRESATRPLPFGMLYLAEGIEDEARRRARAADGITVIILMHSSQALQGLGVVRTCHA